MVRHSSYESIQALNNIVLREIVIPLAQILRLVNTRNRD
jgi:hypothetical protein